MPAEKFRSRGRRAEVHTIAESATGYLIGPKAANPDLNQIARTGSEDRLSTGSAQDQSIAVAVAIGDDTLLGVVLDEIDARAAPDRKPVVGDRNAGIGAPAILVVTSAGRVSGACKDAHVACRRRCIN